MKKLTVAIFACAVLMTSAYAQQEATATTSQATTFTRVETRTVSPVGFTLIGEDTIDIIGLRLNAVGDCHNLTGLDLSILGSAQNAYGLQIALLKNEVRDVAGALQIAILANEAQFLTGAQVAILWNQASSVRGAQIGITNVANDVRGLQIGLINSTDIIYGYQIGLINVIRGSKVPFFPVLNFMFEDE